MTEFDFDKMAALSKSDPQAFEAERMRLLREAIDSRPEFKHRGEQVLFRIEATRAVAKSPLQSALLASRLMWTAFEELRQSLNNGVATMAIQKARASSSKAAVLPFVKKTA